jgi:polyisoprenoid-binding protein YceI
MMTETTTAETAAAGETAAYAVDVAASSVTWYGSKPIGLSESGTVNLAEGQLNFAGEQLVDGTIVIDMASIATTSQSGGMADQLVGHLSSDDFFGVATYPTAQLVLKSAEPTGTANQYLVKADLTIKETTKAIEFVTDVAVAGGTLNGTAEIIVNRADFDVRYNSGSFFSDLGDDLISDEMTITVVLVAQQG